MDNTKLLRHLANLLLGFALVLYSSTAVAQITSGLSIGWNVSVGCQTFSMEDIRGEKEPVSLEDIADGTCIKVCEGSIVTYTLSGTLGSSPNTQWALAGGTISTQSSSACTIQWGAFGAGNLSFIVNTPTGVVSKTICFEKIIKPKALFNVMPQIQSDRAIYSCIDQTIYFTNQSTANNGTALYYYFWDFGDTNYSTAFAPNHSYAQNGEYWVTLTVTNTCNCQSIYKRKIIVQEKGFDIICPSVVCDGQTTTYSLPFDGREICRDKYKWTVIGGELASVNSQGDATVNWNQVDENGFGYVTFDPSNCRLGCLLPTTIKVPVIQTKGTIIGNATMCLGDQGIYKLPQWPTTDFQWEVIGNASNGLAEVILSDQRNQVIIKPLVSGTLTLRATYQNTMLHCGGTALFTINVTQPIDFSGDMIICQGTLGNYTSSEPTIWTLKNNSGTVINTLTNSSTYSYNFTVAGGYTLSIGGSGDCLGQSKNIMVVAVPLGPVAASLAGSLEVCPNAPYTYSLPNDPTAQYHWAVTNGTFIGSNIGNQVSISFNGTAPAQLLVYKETVAPAACHSLPTVIPVTLKQISAEVSIANASVCANSYAPYQANNIGTTTLYTQGETYAWRISNPALGSISTGQGTNSVSVLWNNVSTITYVDLIVVIKKCTLTKTIVKQIQIRPTPHIQITALPAQGMICSGSPIFFTITSTNGVPIDPNAAVTWNYGYGDVLGTPNGSMTFTNTTNANIGRNVTAFITNHNGCVGITNTASFTVTVLSGPPATASLSTPFNSFCLQSQISATLTSASALSGVTLQWYNGSMLLSGQTATTLAVTPATGFGSYTFVATNISTGCATRSNPVQILQNCGNGPCIYTPVPNITNNSDQSCAVLNLNGAASGSFQSQSWTILGPPAVALVGYTGSTYTVTEAGEFHIYKKANYLNGNGEVCEFNAYKKVTVPYIPDFAYTTTCNGNTDFTVTMTDKTDFFAPVTARTVSYFYKLNSASLWTGPVSGTSITLSAGNYQIKIVAQGTLGSIQPPCDKIRNISIATVPNQNITVAPFNCYDTAVEFNLSGTPVIGDSFLWTFEPGTANEASITLKNSKRVFSSSGTKTVKLVITNKYGCTRELTTTVAIPDKCFNGNVTSTPALATVCVGTPVTIQYVPSGDACPVSQYIWMNGQDPVLPASNAASIQVNSSGFYWVRLVSAAGCTYETSTRITPNFKTPPSITLSGPAASCQNTEITINATTNAANLSWSIDGGAPAYINQASITLTGLSVGNHTIVCTATSSAPDFCTNSASQTVSIMAAPDVPTITQEVICEPYYHVVLTAASNVSGLFNWSNGLQGATITVTDGGPYRVQVTNGGCLSENQTDVPKNPEDYMWIFPSGCHTDCIRKEGVGTLIGPRLPLPYWGWQLDGAVVLSGNESFTAPLNLNSSGTYNLEINTGGCSLLSQPLNYTMTPCDKCKIENAELKDLNVNEGKFCSFTASISISSGADMNVTIVAPNNDVVINPSGFLVNAGNTVSTFTIIPVSGFVPGPVMLRIESVTEEGFPCTYEFMIDVPSCQGSGNSKIKTGIVAAVNDARANIEIFPNPAKAEVNIRYNGLDIGTTLELYDLMGRNLIHHSTDTSDGVWTLPTASYPAGVYIVVVRSGMGLLTQQKLIIQ